jgi:type IV secretory pathway VirB2 component (pilin)
MTVCMPVPNASARAAQAQGLIWEVPYTMQGGLARRLAALIVAVAAMMVMMMRAHRTDVVVITVVIAVIVVAAAKRMFAQLGMVAAAAAGAPVPGSVRKADGDNGRAQGLQRRAKAGGASRGKSLNGPGGRQAGKRNR